MFVFYPEYQETIGPPIELLSLHLTDDSVGRKVCSKGDQHVLRTSDVSEAPLASQVPAGPGPEALHER